MTRFTDEVRFRFEGDKDRARKYVSAGRKVLGALGGILAPNVTTGAISREVAPGVIVTAQFLMGLPLITIYALAPNVAGEEFREFASTVCTPRDDSNPDGIHATFPEVLLRPRVSPQRTLWTADYGSTAIADGQGAAEPKGSYLPNFPDGIHYFGNVDWRGPSNERLSWYGPYSRYWPDRKFFTVTGTPFVFYLGEILIYGPGVDVDEPILEGDVKGAALWRSEGAIYAHVIHQTGNVHTLVRYELLRNEAAPGLNKYAVSGYEIVSDTTLSDMLTSWFFNGSGTAAVCMTDPPAPWGDPIPTSSTIGRLAVAEDGTASWSTESASFDYDDTYGYPEVPIPGAYVAIDFDGDEEVSIRIVDGSQKIQNPAEIDPRAHFNITPEPHQVYGVLDFRGSLFFLTGGPFQLADANTWAEHIVYANLRDNVVYSIQVGYDADDVASAQPRLYRNGQLLAEEQHLLDQGPLLYDPRRWLATSTGSYNPRMIMTAYIQTDVVEPVINDHTFGHLGFMSYPINGNDTWATHTSEWHPDAFDVPTVGFVSAGGARTVASFARFITNAEDTPPGRPALNFITATTLPRRLSISSADSAFFPGAPLGRPIE